MSEREGLKVAKRIWVDPHKQLRNRKPITGSVETAGTKKALYTGTFIALTIVVSNDSPGAVWFEIYDGDAKVIGRGTLAANEVRPLTNLWLPFNRSVEVNSNATTTIFTFGGFTP
ncbi:hypothetical protein KEJ15_04100 [Candidatus Bathyarchaeota archaeon]|nr:hypothetical protein [Candidatus Bathyarchaeota archaeon]